MVVEDRHKNDVKITISLLPTINRHQLFLSVQEPLLSFYGIECEPIEVFNAKHREHELVTEMVARGAKFRVYEHLCGRAE